MNTGEEFQKRLEETVDRLRSSYRVVAEAVDKDSKELYPNNTSRAIKAVLEWSLIVNATLLMRVEALERCTPTIGMDGFFEKLVEQLKGNSQ